MEVVQQIGSDSFAPGHGVLIGKSKTGSSTCGTYSCFVWYIDSNPQDIDQVDHVKADGTIAKATPGDERQLNDGSFNVGVNSGGEYEYKTDANGLHFYILDKRTDEQGILRYTVGVRSLEGAGPQTRGVALSNPVLGHGRRLRDLHVRPQEHGRRRGHPGRRAPDTAPTRSSARDIYRLSAIGVRHGLVRPPAQRARHREVRRDRPGPGLHREGDRRRGQRLVTLTATSESDPTKTQSATCSTTGGTVGGTVPATLALTMGAPASFGPFTPGAQKDYFATTDGDRHLHRR